ncbi:MAG: hypothetical protein E6586_04005 [Bifidobacterium scardovii]|uniref:glycosyltransferase family 39 protein n=1 Tax=Bifidobacterium scardovii TaxID=158787 RepID=UPI000666682A|nr:hypothetical protein [Bifidobacterium scardovii]MBS6947779.1 hypothetical protein [Bifidobacterium scardovii]MDU3736230.1 hypothetical protein [Bifidobacterium scardovii]MDU5297167.1 hypothetical protein [Bifidobacterium scardovii]MDU5611567.1 hypothetical protein [Bifidobacterium scardovii]MDU5887117.1 hypothetical protein [Bifidobacterium scardovii]
MTHRNRTGAHRRTPVFSLAVALCAIAAASTSFLMGRNQSLWFDEQYSLLLAGKPIRSLIALTAVDAHPPLYYLMLKAWMPLTGGDVAALRLLNCLLLGAAVMVMLILLRDLFGTRTASLCMPFLLCGGFMLRYGYELRMYSLAMLVAVFGTYAILRATATIGGDAPSSGTARDAVRSRADRRPRIAWWTAYACTVALGMYTLYLTAFVWLAHAIWLAWRSWRRLTVYIASLALYLPWMPVLLSQMRHSVLPPIRRAMNMSGVASALDTVMLGMTERELPSLVSLLVLATLLSIFAMAVIALNAPQEGMPDQSDQSDRRPPAAGRNSLPHPIQLNRAAFVLIIMLAAVPPVIMIVWSAAKELSTGGYGLFSIRYLSVAMPFGYSAMALSCIFAAARRPCLARLAYAAVLVALLAGTVTFAIRGNHSFDRSDTPGSAALSRSVSCSSSRPVIAQDEYTYIDAYWYYRDCPAYYFLDADDVPARGGYAPLRHTAAQLKSLDPLAADRFTLLSWSTRRDYDALLHATGWARGGVTRRGANAAVEYRRRPSPPPASPQRQAGPDRGPSRERVGYGLP